MYIEESGADLTVTVEGHEYHTEASVDVDSDGLDDTAIVETDDGSIAFTDTDDDGQADLMTQLDADGDIVAQARFDAAAGEWVHVDEPRDPGAPMPPQPASTATMTVDTPRGPVEVGAPTDDTDGDGRLDTVVVKDAAGDTVIYTDADEDGDADFATEITGDGHITVSEHSADGDWTVVERGHLDESGAYHRDPTADADAGAEESGWISSPWDDRHSVHVDPRTGTWTTGAVE